MPTITDDLVKMHVLLQFNKQKCNEWMSSFEKQMRAASKMRNVFSSLVGDDPRFAKNNPPERTKNHLKLSRALEYFEGYCWFPANRVLLGGLLSSEDFLRANEMGFSKDPGAGAKHGEQSHRLQWHVLMREITKDFTVPFDRGAGWENSPLQLYWTAIHKEGEKSFWGQMIDMNNHQGWGNPDRVLEHMRKAVGTLAGMAVERRLDKRQSFDTGQVGRAGVVFKKSDKIQRYEAAILSKQLMFEVQRCFQTHQFTVGQSGQSLEKKMGYLIDAILNEIYTIEKVGVPQAPAAGTKQSVAKKAYLAVNGPPGNLPPKYHLNGNVITKNDAPDQGITIDGTRIGNSMLRFNTAQYGYLSVCGAFPKVANRW